MTDPHIARPAPASGLPPSALEAGIFAVSLAILLVELLLTRVFSVVMYHHFSFLSVSLAMTGIGLGGLLVTLLPRTFRRDNLSALGPALAIGFAVMVIAGSWVAFHTPIKLQETADNWSNLIWILLSCLVPFILGGLVIAHILAFNAERAHRLYFFDLFGAGLACLLFVPLVRWVGAPSALLVAAAIAVLGGACLARSTTTRIAGAVLALAVLGAAQLNTTRGFFDLRFAKGGDAAPTLVTRWNAFSRVEVRGTPDDLYRLRPPVSWGFSSMLRTQARELHLLYDADAMTQIVGFDGDLKKVEYLLWDVTSAAHHVRKSDNVLVIGAGGGRDVLAALAGGARSVAGVEINDVTVELMRTRFHDYTDGLYVDHPRVAITVEDGRSYVQHTEERFDLIQASLVDTWAASAAGAYALAENSLYTVDAVGDYLDKLTPDGMVSFSRWYADPPVETMRVVVLAREALRSVGVTDPSRHVMIVRTDSRMTRRPSLATVLLKKTPFTDAEQDALRGWASAMMFDLPYVPGPASTGPDDGSKGAAPVGARGSEPAFLKLFFGEELASLSVDSAAIDIGAYDLSPTTDDKPFFFDRVPLVGWIKYRLGLPAPAWAASELPLASRTLLVALIVTTLNAMLLIALPAVVGVARGRKVDAASSGARGALSSRLAWMTYFAALGLGYIVVEIVLIQRLNLYLGNPAFALTVVLFTMLASSGAGSLFAERFTDPRALSRILATVVAGIALVWLTIDPFIHLTLGASRGIRIILAVLYVAPVAFVMGMPFPTGLRLAGRESESLVPWAWAVNGATSVLGSVLAVVVSMTAGFSMSLVFAGIAYAVGFAVSRATAQRASR
jgi:spermidine synthase